MVRRLGGHWGQGETEYALLIAGIGLAVLVMLRLFGAQLAEVYQWIISHLVL